MGFEIRRYPPQVVAETRVSGAFDEVGREGAKVLNDYVSGNNRRSGDATAAAGDAAGTPAAKGEKGEKIEVTPPVLQAASEDGAKGSYVIAFVIAPKHLLAALPRPNDPRVALRQVPAKLLAAHRYSGSWNETNYRQHERILLDALKLAHVKAIGTPMQARYDRSFKPSFMRRNEALVEVEPPAPQ
jgi:hypothetical protein